MGATDGQVWSWWGIQEEIRGRMVDRGLVSSSPAYQKWTIILITNNRVVYNQHSSK